MWVADLAGGRGGFWRSGAGFTSLPNLGQLDALALAGEFLYGERAAARRTCGAQ